MRASTVVVVVFVVVALALGLVWWEPVQPQPSKTVCFTASGDGSNATANGTVGIVVIGTPNTNQQSLQQPC